MPSKLSVNCPKCHSAGQVPESFAGHTIHCKKCDTHFPVPTSHPASPHYDPMTATPNSGRASQPPAAATAVADRQPADGRVSLLDALSDDSELQPLTPDDEKHARERYEARVLSKDRSAHYDDKGNLMSEEEMVRKNLQKKSHDL